LLSLSFFSSEDLFLTDERDFVSWLLTLADVDSEVERAEPSNKLDTVLNTSSNVKVCIIVDLVEGLGQFNEVLHRPQAHAVTVVLSVPRQRHVETSQKSDTDVDPALVGRWDAKLNAWSALVNLSEDLERTLTHFKIVIINCKGSSVDKDRIHCFNSFQTILI